MPNTTYQKVRVLSPLIEAAVGNLPEYNGIFFAGDSDLINSSEFRTVWGLDTAYDTIMTPITMSIVSDNAADTAAGTGAQSVQVQYLDSSFIRKIAILEMNGTTPVAMPEDLIGVNDMRLLAAGNTGTNAGSITLENGSIGAFIAPGQSVARQAVQTVPAGKTWIAQGFFASVNTGDAVNVRAIAVSDTGVRYVISENFVSGEYNFQNFNGIPFPEKFRLDVQAKSESGTDVSVNVIIQFLEYDPTLEGT